MPTYIVRNLYALAPALLAASSVSIFVGCSKADTEKAPATNPRLQAQEVQASIASAQAGHNGQEHHVGHDDGSAAPNAPMAMEEPSGGNPSMNMPQSAGSAPIGMARMLGRPPMASSANAKGSLPPAIGAPHIYHLGADTFFLDQASAIGLTGDQRIKLTALKEDATASYATVQRRIDQGEQDLWVLTASEAPQLPKIDMKIAEIARLTGQQRMAFIRQVGEAVGVLSDAQRKAVASPGGSADAPAPPTTSGMGTTGAGAPASGGMQMGAPSQAAPAAMAPSGTPPPAAKGMGGMGHM